MLDALRHVRMAVVGKRKQKARRKRVAVVLVHLHQRPDDGLNTRLIHAVGVGVKVHEARKAVDEKDKGVKNNGDDRERNND